MDIKYVTEYLLVNLFYIYLLNRFMRIFFNRDEENRWNQTLIYSICYILNSGGNLLFNNPIINMFTSIFSILLISVLYKAGISKRIAAILMIYSICITCDIIEATLMENYIIGKRLSIINIIIVYLLIFSVEIILEKCVQLNDDYNIFKKQMIPAICVPIVSIIIICIIVVNKINTTLQVF